MYIAINVSTDVIHLIFKHLISLVMTSLSKKSAASMTALS